MITALFSFRGRLGRLAYVGWMFAILGLTIVYVTLVVVALLALGFRNISYAPGNLGFFLIVVPGFAGVVWASTAVMVKRCRDAGVPPLAFMIVYVSLGLFDQWVLERLIDLRVSGFLGFKGTPLGVVLSIIPFVLAGLPTAWARREPNRAN